LYIWESGKACKFLPGVGVRFEGTNSATDVLLCFMCGDVQVLREGKASGSVEDFFGMNQLLLPIVKKLFPDDKALQALKANN
jgi:hypothetical protein